MAHVTRGHGIAAIIFGILEVLFGIVIIICGFVLAAKVNNALYSPYWIGFVYLIPGILGIAAGASKNNGCMIAFMVFNIIIFVLLGVASIILFIVLSVFSTIISDINRHCVSFGSTCICNYNGSTYKFTTSCDLVTAMVPAMWAVAICCLVSAIVTLASSILGCVSSCCTSAQPSGGLIVQEIPQGYPPVYVQQQQTAGSYAPPQYMDKSGPI